MFSSIIIITSQLATLVRTKHWNQFPMDISSSVFILIYNNSASSMLLVCNLSHNITSLTDLSNNFLFPNNHRISFLQTLLRNSHYSLSLTLFQSLLTSSLNRRFLSLPIILLCLFILHIFSKHDVLSHITSDRGSEFVSNFFYSLGTTLDI